MSDPSSREGCAPAPLAFINILSVPETGSIWVRFLGPTRILGVHRGKPRQPLVCWGAKDCPKGRHDLPYRCKWYAPVQQYVAAERVWRSFVLEITEALEMLLRGRTLRGEVWCLRRESLESNDRKSVTGTFEERLDSGLLPDAFEVDPTLKRAYKEAKLPSPKLPNLLPDRPVAADQVAPPPGTTGDADRSRKRQAVERGIAPPAAGSPRGQGPDAWPHIDQVGHLEPTRRIAVAQQWAR